jgi:hypothetical protein
MLKNGEQKIFIWIDFSPETEVTILHGAEVAMILKKEICLIYQLSKDKLLKEQAEIRLTELARPLSLVFGTERVHIYIALHPLGSILSEMAEEYDALLLVAPKTASKELLLKLPLSGFPLLFVSSRHQAGKSYQKIAVPVGYMKKSKDLALWSSYFARHNGAKVSLIKALANFEEDKRLVMSILFSIERLFKNFHFPYETIETHTPTWKIQRKALEQALGFQNGLLIISFSYGSSIIDRILGINDAAVIDRSESLSVMCINSQRDLYTLCG